MSAHPGRLTACFVALLTVAATAAPLAAQEEAAPGEAETRTPLPADSMELGKKYVNWLLDYRADSLWTVFNDRMKERFGSAGDLVDQMGQIFQQVGTQQRVIDQRYWTRNGAAQFWHTADFTNLPEPVVIRLVIDSNGMVTGMGMNPRSQSPPVDDPNQHGDVAGEEGDHDGD